MMQYNQNYKQTYFSCFQSSQNFILSSQASSKVNVKYAVPRQKTQLKIENINLSHIKDPLWRRICGEIVHLMGPIAAQIFQVQMGVPQDKTLDLYCATEEMVEFLETYNFIVLAILQRYFPSLQKLNITSQVAA